MQQGTGGSGQATKMTMLTPDQLKWEEVPAGLPKGAKAAVLSGNPAAAGFFTVRMQVAQDNYTVKPHTHPTDEMITVVKGTFHAGMGTQFDKSAAKDYSEGSFLVMPANSPHFAWADKDTIIQISGAGPFQIKYVNPADDPRQQGVGGAGQSGQTSDSTNPPAK
jgi:quercetin dioxygenase-like cupin family protein